MGLFKKKEPEYKKASLEPMPENFYSTSEQPVGNVVVQEVTAVSENTIDALRAKLKKMEEEEEIKKQVEKKKEEISKPAIVETELKEPTLTEVLDIISANMARNNQLLTYIRGRYNI